MTSLDLPLSGTVVLDLGQIYQGPYAGFLAAQAGAEVIKIEPRHGEPLRRRTKGGGASVPLAMLNANKRGITLDLKHRDGKRLLRDMVRRADVLIENFAPGVMDRLELGYERLTRINPRLVYGSGTGYGLSGPDRDNLAMDLTVQAYSGMMSVTGFADRFPVKAGPAVADFMSGTHLYAAIVTALLQRERTGKGRLVEVSMQEAVYPSMASNIGMYFDTGTAPRTDNRHGGLSVVPYNVYATKDGHVAIITVTEAHWRNLLTAMDRADLVDDANFASNQARIARMDEVDALVQTWTRDRTRDEVFAMACRRRRSENWARSSLMRTCTSAACCGGSTIPNWAVSRCRAARCGFTGRPPRLMSLARVWASTIKRSMSIGSASTKTSSLVSAMTK